MTNVTLQQNAVAQLAAQADAVEGLAKDTGAFAAVFAAFESNDPNALGWVLQRLELLPLLVGRQWLARLAWRLIGRLIGLVCQLLTLLHSGPQRGHQRAAEVRGRIAHPRRLLRHLAELVQSLQLVVERNHFANQAGRTRPGRVGSGRFVGSLGGAQVC